MTPINYCESCMNSDTDICRKCVSSVFGGEPSNYVSSEPTQPPEQKYKGVSPLMNPLKDEDERPKAEDFKLVFSECEYDQSAKADAGKAQLRLVPSEIIYDIAEVREYGNRKYGDSESWKTVEKERYIDAMLRHALAFKDDIYGRDKESGLPHLWHLATNVAFLCEMVRFDEG